MNTRINSKTYSLLDVVPKWNRDVFYDSFFIAIFSLLFCFLLCWNIILWGFYINPFCGMFYTITTGLEMYVAMEWINISPDLRYYGLFYPGLILLVFSITLESIAHILLQGEPQDHRKDLYLNSVPATI
jgi:hypothetical protein